MFQIEEELKKLPRKPGVYIMRDKEDVILYVGKAVNLHNRVRSYFRENIGISPVEYLIQYRISIACKILRESSDKIASVSVRVGYDNVSYFCRIFKKLVGKSPSQYRTEAKSSVNYPGKFS